MLEEALAFFDSGGEIAALVRARVSPNPNPNLNLTLTLTLTR